MFNELRRINPDISLYHVAEVAFSKYGRIITNVDCTELLAKLKERETPEEGNVYIASDPELEALPIAEYFQTEIYGGFPIQIGYCNGNSYQLNAMEYHKCPELNIATENIILFLARTSDIHNDRFSTENVEAFFIPKNTLIELDGSTMHFAPCKTSEKGFKTIVVLARHTNEDFPEETIVKGKSLFQKNKWLLTHPDNERMMSRGAYPGIVGTNFEIKQPIAIFEGGDQ